VFVVSRRFFVLVIIVSSSRMALAQPCAGTIDGHAVDASTHEPIVAATVRIGDSLVATTDDAGRFTLTGQCAGPVTIVVERDDYKPAEHTVALAARASVEVEMTTSGEVIEIRE
jgi:uncharacterized glyoxalase superfamily protein PhnB